MKKVLLLIILVFTIVTSKSQGLHYQWHKNATSYAYTLSNDTTYRVVKIANVSNYNAIAVIDVKNETWNYITSSSLTYSLLSNANVYMKNSQEGIILNAGAYAYKTSDRWLTVNSFTNLPAGLNVSGTTPFGYYGYLWGSVTYTVVFSSDGVTWNSVLTSSNTPSFSTINNEIYTIQNGTLKFSTNGGASYSTINNTVTLNGQIYTPSADTIYVADTQLMRSFDGGLTWSSVNYPPNSYSQMACKNGKELLFINPFSTPKTISYSNNSGLSYSTYTTVPSSYSNEKLIANGNSFILYPSWKTSDGATWVDFLGMAHAPKPYDISITENIVLEGSSQGYFGYSTNRGANFTFLPNKITSNQDIMAVKAIDINKFLVGDRKGQVYISTDQGASWTQKNSSTFNLITRKFSISQDKNTIVCSRLGMPLMSIDAGNTFSIINVGGGTHYQTVKPTAGTMVDVGPLLDGSFNLVGWEFSTFDISNIKTVISTITVNNPNESIIDIYMKDDNIGYFMTRNASNNETVVYKTTNGWVNTTSITAIPSPTSTATAYDGRYGNIQTFGTDTVIISGSGNPVNNQTNFYHISYNGGVTWNLVYTDFSKPTSLLGNSVYKMVFFNPNEYMALVSDNFSGGPQASAGVYLGASSSGTVSTSVNELNFTNTDNSFKVYPNPAHDALNIDVAVFANDSKPLQVFITDVVGKLVSTSIVTKQNAQINTSSLKEGIYFVSIEKEGKLYTSKFIKQ